MLVRPIFGSGVTLLIVGFWAYVLGYPTLSSYLGLIGLALLTGLAVVAAWLH